MHMNISYDTGEFIMAKFLKTRGISPETLMFAYMKNPIVIGLIFVLSGLLFSCESAQSKPNILLINVDDMGWKDLGIMGSKYYETPTLDSLLQTGALFTNAYAGAANCSPSRACLMTGQWPTRHGVYTVGSSARGKKETRRLIPIQNTRQVDSSFTLLPETLQKAGYRTCHAGKWHVSDDPLADGFDVNIGGGPNGLPRSYYPPYKNVNLEPGKSEYLTDLIMEKTIDFVATTKEPFFLYYSPYAVHTPIQAVDRYVPKYQNKTPDQGQDNPDYASMVENLDRNLGLLMAALHRKKQDDNLLIIFTSDNGGLLGITDQHPLRAGKGAYYEGGIRVPMAIIWRGKVAAGKQTSLPVSNLDVYPTLLNAAGIDYDKKAFDGDALLPIPQAEEVLNNRPLIWHFPIYLQAYYKNNLENRDPAFRTRPGSVIRTGDWKLHYYFEDDGIELYNLAEDIGERNNLSTENPVKTEEMLTALRNWWKKNEAPIPNEPNPDFVAEETGR
jgi:arylsulfatase A-like enzyme